MIKSPRPVHTTGGLAHVADCVGNGGIKLTTDFSGEVAGQVILAKKEEVRLDEPAFGMLPAAA